MSDGQVHTGEPCVYLGFIDPVEVRRAAITEALRARGCVCKHRPTWAWTDSNHVRCGCATAAFIARSTGGRP